MRPSIKLALCACYGMFALASCNKDDQQPSERVRLVKVAEVTDDPNNSSLHDTLVYAIAYENSGLISSIQRSDGRTTSFSYGADEVLVSYSPNPYNLYDSMILNSAGMIDQLYQLRILPGQVKTIQYGTKYQYDQNGTISKIMGLGGGVIQTYVAVNGDITSCFDASTVGGVHYLYDNGHFSGDGDLMTWEEMKQLGSAACFKTVHLWKGPDTNPITYTFNAHNKVETATPLIPHGDVSKYIFSYENY